MPEQTKPDEEKTRRTSKQEAQSGEDTESSDLEEREYRDDKGEVHHHTKKYMEQHEGEGAASKEEE